MYSLLRKNPFMLTWATLMMTMIMWLMLTHPEVPWSSPWFSTPCSLQARRTQPPSESLPASYGPGAGMRVRVFACAPFVPLCGLRSDPCKLRSALRPSESLPVSYMYGPGAGLRA